MPALPSAESLRILCLDGGGIKGYTSLLILKRIFRTIVAEGNLNDTPRPCDVFDLIAGTSTGGLIAVMLGRLHMTIDECIAMYEQLGKEVFGRRQIGGQLGHLFKGMASSTFYDIEILQEQVRKALDSLKIPRDEYFIEAGTPICKVILCVTRKAIGKPDVLRNYESLHPTAENYWCRIWEAASATAAAPIYFKSVTFAETGEKFCDGGLRRNNPINEALSEVSREKDWQAKKIGCVLSIGTGATRNQAISSNLASFLKASLKIMTDSEDIAKVFAATDVGIELGRTNRYFRFNVPQGMQDLQLDEWKETEKMRALATEYLSHPVSGGQVTRCALSLLYPDENLQEVIKPKLSILPYHPCTHFIPRPYYADKLRNFFAPHMEYRQIFILWGLGGVGKTQIALEFAQKMKYRLSVFWIRADQTTNFITDYTQILDQIDRGGKGPDRSSMDQESVLDMTRRKLEELSGDWLLILDNADDLEQFIGSQGSSDDPLSIRKYIPRRGRILITTRDRRFQGSVAAANDGVHVDPMSESEAKDLLIKSIPNYLVRDVTEANFVAKELLEELGYLPLAIAQAAANIVDQGLTVEEYVSFYRDKHQRMILMQKPVHDFQSTDPRNSSQSVLITWKISFDVLKAKFPMSSVFLSYLGCFHWRQIPRALLQRLPEFQKMSEPEFFQMTKKPLNLSLVEETYDREIDLVEYHIHPLVHENLMGQVAADSGQHYVESALELVSNVFPLLRSRTSTEFALASYLAPHSVRQVELCKSMDIVNVHLIHLLHGLSLFFGLSSMFTVAADLSVQAVQLATDTSHPLWEPDPYYIIVLQQNAADRLIEAARKRDAEQMTRKALELLESDVLKSKVDSVVYERQRILLLSTLSTALVGLDSDKEREDIGREQLKSNVVNPRTHFGITVRHNLAHSLLKQGKVGEANVINQELLAFSDTEEGRLVVDVRLRTIMLNLRALILAESMNIRNYAGYDKVEGIGSPEDEERHQIYQRVLTESLEFLGIDDLDTWIAANNFVGFLIVVCRYDEIGPVLREVLSAGIAAKVKAEGKFSGTMHNLYEAATNYLSYLSISAGPDAAITTEIKDLLMKWATACEVNHVPLESEGGFHTILNNRGVYAQRAGNFKLAETYHQQAIDQFLSQRGEGTIVPNVYLYNMALALARQGRLAEAIAFRKEHKEQIGIIEAGLGTIETRLEQDAAGRSLYLQAKSMLEAGQISRGDKWWLANVKALDKAEAWYGRLEPPKTAPDVVTSVPHRDEPKMEEKRAHRYSKFTILLKKRG